MKPFEPESFPPKDIDIVSLMPLIGAANRAIATLDGLFYGIPNGRMIIPLFLFEKKILSRPCFYLSAYFEANREEYIARLRNLGQPGSWTQWCALFIKGVVAQSEANTKKARGIQDLYERLKKQVLELTHSQFAVPLLDFMFERPIFRGSEVAKRENMPSAPMVAGMLLKLREHGILHTVREG